MLRYVEFYVALLFLLVSTNLSLNVAIIRKITPIFQRILPQFNLKSIFPRRNPMPTVLITIGIISMNPVISIAQIPSMSDYNTGSGTVIRPRNIIKTPSRMIDYSTTNVRELLSTIIPSYLAEVKDFSSQGSWNLINKSSKPMRKSILRDSFFGKSSSQELAKALEVSADMGANLEALREELFFAVCQVGDFAISNQVYVFNEEDLKQVKLLREADSSEGELSADDKDMQIDEDEDEVKRVAEEGRKLVADLEAIVDRIVKFTM